VVVTKETQVGLPVSQNRLSQNQFRSTLGRKRNLIEIIKNHILPMQGGMRRTTVTQQSMATIAAVIIIITILTAILTMAIVINPNLL
jgi:hypothetical protein